jgi:hypothetical protein
LFAHRALGQVHADRRRYVPSRCRTQANEQCARVSSRHEPCFCAPSRRAFEAARARGTRWAVCAALDRGRRGASTHEPLPRLAETDIETIAGDDPLTATALGLPGADGKLAIPNEAARAARIARLDGWKAEIEATLQATSACRSPSSGPSCSPTSTRRARSAPPRTRKLYVA